MIFSEIRYFIRLLSYVKKYNYLIVLGIVLIFVYSFSNSIFIVSLKPLTEGVLFNKNIKESRTNLDSNKIKKNTQHVFYINKIKDNIETKYFDFIKQSRPIDILKISVFVIFASLIIRSISSYVKNLIFLKLNLKMMYNLRMDIFKKCINLSMSFFDRTNTGHLMNRVIYETGSIEGIMISSISGLVTNIAFIFFSFIILFSINFKLTLIILVILPSAVFASQKIGRILKKYYIQIQDQTCSIVENVQQAFVNIKYIILSGKQDYEIGRYKRALKDYQNTVTNVSKLGFLSSPASDLIITMVVMGVLFYGLSEKISIDALNTLKSGNFVVFSAFVFSLISPFKSLTSFFFNFQKSAVTAKRIFEILDKKSDVIEKKNAIDFDHLNEKIEFNNVSFSYDNKKEALKDINITIEKGTTVAFVGISGSGKTTLASLILRLYDPTNGKVFIDNTDIKDYNINSLRSKIGIVTQETILFNDTIANNISYGNKNISFENIKRAAKYAHAEDFILSLEGGYNHIIGNRGSLLSGGEKQRIAIARAILNDPEILIFDEATSELDTQSELKIKMALKAITKNRTSIIIAHRMSTVKDADVIFVLDNGRIVGAGSHSDLILNNIYYKRINQDQLKE